MPVATFELPKTTHKVLATVGALKLLEQRLLGFGQQVRTAAANAGEREAIFRQRRFFVQERL